jgi:hypothetical protein
MKLKTIPLLLIFALLTTLFVRSDSMRAHARTAAPDLYIADSTNDTGIEINPDGGAMWSSPEVWLRTEPDPAYQPYPFVDPTYPNSSHSAHENAEYRDPKYSRPNYIYVRVHNRGDAQSLGTEKLRVFWSHISPGPGWPTEWGGGPWTKGVDYLSNLCGPTKLYGGEITKPRENAATADPAERTAYREAILAIGTEAPYEFPADGVSYWHKQQEVHADMNSMNKHDTPLFAPWHREFINRYELLLQEKDPTVRLLYWDWTVNPETGPFNFFANSMENFMGASGSGPGSAPIGAPFNPSSGPTLAPPFVRRDRSSALSTASDADVLDETVHDTYSDKTTSSGVTAGFVNFLEHDAHNYAHGHIRGDMNNKMTATQDPFFFLVHANADRLWSKWQRNPSVLERLDRGKTYDDDSTQADMLIPMKPWDGSSGISPWTAADGYLMEKYADDPSVVSPPLYDDTPLVIPKLQPGESVIMQIPWYPPNPADYAGNGCNQRHFCLLSRIETSDTPPYGMFIPEGVSVYFNTQNNNNIAGKNLDIVDSFPGAFKRSTVIVRNPFSQAVRMGLNFIRLPKSEHSFFKFGRVILDLPPEMLKRWREENSEAGRIKTFRDKDGYEKFEITSPETSIQNILLAPGEAFPLGVQFVLNGDYQAQPGMVAKVNLAQTGAPGAQNAMIGGQQFDIPLDRLVLIKEESDWRYLSTEDLSGNNWTQPKFDDSKWKTGKAELGYGDEPEVTIDGGPPAQRRITAYFRHVFELDDPAIVRDMILRLKRDDGALVYLNGTEIHRINLPAGTVTAGTLATREVGSVEEETFFSVGADPKLLREGQNVIAVEIHQNSPGTDDAGFDLELSANNVLPRFAPYVSITSVENGALVQKGDAVTLAADAMDGDGSVESVSFFVDGNLAVTVDDPPFTFQLTGLVAGRHRLKAVALDNNGQQGVKEVTITVLNNTPPLTRLLQPADMSTYMTNGVLNAVAEASDPGGKVQRVDFYLRSMEMFVAENKLVGSAAKAPYGAGISLRGFAPGHYMLTAVAVDNLGARRQSSPVTIHIGMLH